MDDADIQMVVRGVLFAAVGTAGQRCTSVRRLVRAAASKAPRDGTPLLNCATARGVGVCTRRVQILHEKIHDRVIAALVDAYKQVPIGDPLKRTGSRMIWAKRAARAAHHPSLASGWFLGPQPARSADRCTRAGRWRTTSAPWRRCRSRCGILSGRVALLRQPAALTTLVVAM